MYLSFLREPGGQGCSKDGGIIVGRWIRDLGGDGFSPEVSKFQTSHTIHLQYELGGDAPPQSLPKP